MAEAPQSVVEELLAAAKAMGFALAGVCEATPSAFARELREWLAQGQHGTMDWLSATADARLDIERFLPGTRSVIVVADQYAAQGDRSGISDDPASTADERRDRTATGRVARYALGRDYHKTISRRLHRLADALRERFPGAAFRSFVDSSPVFEREHAHRAGLGWIGKHTLVINPALGSYLLLGGIATTLELATPGHTTEGPISRSPASIGSAMTDHCGQCTRCIDACPTRAITPYRVDASRCISYLTIEHTGPIAPELHAPIGDWLLGCDVCQEVCPFNRESGMNERSEKPEARSMRTPAGGGGGRGAVNSAYTRDSVRIAARWDVLDLLTWTPEDRAQRLGSSAVKRATLEVLKRNALIVLGNAMASMAAGSPDRAAALARVQAIALDDQEPDLLRETASQVLRRLNSL